MPFGCVCDIVGSCLNANAASFSVVFVHSMFLIYRLGMTFLVLPIPPPLSHKPTPTLQKCRFSGC
jgi:hypothetical protein